MPTLGNKPARRSTAVLIKVSDEELVRHGLLAFEDGYADARSWGEDGFFVSAKYNAYERERYIEGFNRGLRVWRVTNNSR